MKDLNIGDGLQVRIVAQNEEPIAYQAILLDDLDENHCAISGPILKGEKVFVKRDALLEVSFLDMKKGKIYFKAQVTDTQVHPVYTLIIQAIEPIRKIQVRNYYRLKERNQIILKHPKNVDGREVTVEELSLADDISGGGASFFSNYKHQLGDIIFLELPFVAQKGAILTKVVRILPSPFRNFEYKICTEFHEVSPKDKEAIIYYVFKRQREIKKQKEEI